MSVATAYSPGSPNAMSNRLITPDFIQSQVESHPIWKAHNFVWACNSKSFFQQVTRLIHEKTSTYKPCQMSRSGSESDIPGVRWREKEALCTCYFDCYDQDQRNIDVWL